MSAWLLGVKPGTRFNSGSHDVRVDPAWGSRNVCSVPGREVKSLMGYPLPFYGKASIQTKTNNQIHTRPFDTENSSQQLFQLISSRNTLFCRLKSKSAFRFGFNREFVADSVIQATVTVEFEDGLRMVVLLGGCWGP